MARVTNKLSRFFLDSKGLPVFWALMWVALFASGYLMWVDYQTSRLGYEMLPVQKYSNLEIMVMAGMPQLIQMIATYVLIGTVAVSDNDGVFKTKAIAFGVLILFAGIDIYSDTHFRVQGSYTSMYETVVGLVLTIVFFTLGCEMLFSFTTGMLKDINKRGYESFRDTIVELFEIIADVIGTIIKLVLGFLGVVVGVFVAKKSGVSAPKPNLTSNPKPQKTRRKSKYGG